MYRLRYRIWDKIGLRARARFRVYSIMMENRRVVCETLFVCLPFPTVSLCGYHKLDYYRPAIWTGKLNQRANWAKWKDERDYRANVIGVNFRCSK